MKMELFQKKDMPKGLNFKRGAFIHLLLSVLLGVLILSHCSGPHEKDNGNKITVSPPDSIRQNYSLIADTINYGVVVHNLDSADLWKKKSLSGFDRKNFIDLIFNSIYNKEIQPYDYFTGESLSVRDIKKLENDPEFSRSKIGKIQFLERWYIETTTLNMVKKVHSVMLAYETFRDDGSFRGYKPAFKIFLPKERN